MVVCGDVNWERERPMRRLASGCVLGMRCVGGWDDGCPRGTALLWRTAASPAARYADQSGETGRRLPFEIFEFRCRFARNGCFSA